MTERIHSSVFVHETAIVDDGARIGAGSKIWHFVHVCGGAAIGGQCSLGQNVFVANQVTLGDGVRVQNNVSLYEGVVIEDDVFLGPSCVFTNVINPRSHVARKHEYRPTLVRRGASIGANATIVCGAVIGAYAFVGAGAVVTSDVADYSLVYGVPARHHGWVCACGVRLDGASCDACGARYSITSTACIPEERR